MPSDAEQFFEDLVDSVGTGFAIYDQSGIFKYVNEAYAGLFGVSADTLVGTPIWDINPKFERELFDEYWSSFDDGETRAAETYHEFDGERVPVSVRTTCHEIDGTTYHFGTIRDITDKRERERELVRFRKAIEAAGHAIFLTDRGGTIQYVNPAFEEITGYTAEEAVGRTPRILKSGEMSDDYYREFWETILAGKRWEEMIINRRKNGEYYYANQTVSPITDDTGDVRSFVSIQDDITDRIERKEMLNTLDTVLRHNLRNRLNVILSNTERIQANGAAKLHEPIENVVRNVESLANTVDKGHEIVEFLSTSSYCQPIDIVPVVRTVVTSLRNTYPSARVSLDLPAEAPVLTVNHVDRAIEELVENAIEHNSGATATVALDINCAESHTHLRIEDDGPVIPEIERQVLHEGGDGIDELYHGSGFGLWLVYWIVRRSGGEITHGVATENDAGNVIRITFQNPEHAAAETDSWSRRD